MSLKYERIKQADLALPAPLRWLTRAFSSITLAVILLTTVVLYGMFASVPIAFLARGGLYLLIGVGGIGAAALLAFTLSRRIAGAARWVIVLPLICIGAAASTWGCLEVADWSSRHSWFIRNQATVIYRLPYFEMTELEFYSWWPLRLILLVFVVNMIWATIRRIEFRFVNLGVLTVHVGIVTIAMGSVFYGFGKVEGDTFIFRRDLGGEPVTEFYDGTRPAVFISLGRKRAMIPLKGLPRYNDYAEDRPRKLDIRLHEKDSFQQVAGTSLRASIRGFIAYGQLVPAWTEAALPAGGASVMPGTPGAGAGALNPAIRVALGDASGPRSDHEQMLVAGIPSQRVIDQPAWAVELLAPPSAQRMEDLQASFEGEHGLVVEIPEKKIRQVYAIKPGAQIAVGDTGYRLTVEQIGDYGMSFVTPGYEGASDTRALVRVDAPDSAKPMFRRIVMHRYPERSQDFIPEKEGDASAAAPHAPMMGALGRRTPPDPAIRLAYIDASKLQYRLIIDNHAAATTEPMQLLVRLPGDVARLVTLAEPKFPLPDIEGKKAMLFVTQRIAHAMRTTEPAPTPKPMRRPKDEGTFVNALLPIDLEIDQPAADGQTTTWRKRVWLSHMRYPFMPEGSHKPTEVDVPGVGRVSLMFSRQSYELPFSVALEEFEMQPYPGSDIPRDFVATLTIREKAPDGERTSVEKARLNNPLVYRASSGPWHLRKVKLSQTGWDPGESRDPKNKERDENGRYVNRERFTILGVGNNMGIRAIFVGACLVAAGIPWAFYIKPLLVQRQKRKIQAQLAASSGGTGGSGGSGGDATVPVKARATAVNS